jgi:hypothetical protein
LTPDTEEAAIPQNYFKERKAYEIQKTKKDGSD